jgi:hypothetical protein
LRYAARRGHRARQRHFDPRHDHVHSPLSGRPDRQIFKIGSAVGFGPHRDFAGFGKDCFVRLVQPIAAIEGGKTVVLRLQSQDIPGVHRGFGMGAAQLPALVLDHAAETHRIFESVGMNDIGVIRCVQPRRGVAGLINPLQNRLGADRNVKIWRMREPRFVNPFLIVGDAPVQLAGMSPFGASPLVP